ncbi:MAG: hypothetical protein CFH10_01337 [Alphaproteobacteria bacterium MarineAlpha4_Bin2]|mgnify:CR=1 FL=1|nr:MAG: hypothetical protein CFH10_01337 [Alphaproteobacteria bacterium MarineAlpha4_Bin2]
MSKLVSVGIPLTEKFVGLTDTVESLLAQRYEEIEIILVDDFGKDDVDNSARDLADRDQRIVYVKTPGHFGILPSHAEALARSKGTYFMWIGVGDTLQADYISSCVEMLESKSDLSMVMGRSRMPDGEGSPGLSITEGDPVRRVESFLESDIGLDLWYGMFRRPFIAAIAFRNAVGFEMAFLTEVAFGGKIATVRGASCVRNNTAASSDRHRQDEQAESPESVGNILGVPAFQFGDPYLVVAVQLFCNIAFLSKNFSVLPQIDRLKLAVRAYTRIADRFNIIDEGQFISFAVRIFPEARITERLHEIRLYLATTLCSQRASKALFEPLSRAEEIINGLCRMKIGRLPPAQQEREIVAKLREHFDASESQNFKNRAILALALFI